MLFDTHSHLDQEEFNLDRDEVVARAEAAGVATMLAVGVTGESSEKVVALAERYASIYAAVGVHPNYVSQIAASDWDRVLALVNHPRVVGLGETGLDQYRDYAPLPLQQEYFDRHLRLSQQTHLAFIVHVRSSENEVMAMLREARQRGPITGVMHSFTGTQEMAAECVELGMYISFAGMVTFKKSQDLRDVAATIPADRILVETDSPYLSPQPLRGKRNEPSHIVHTAAVLAEVRGQRVEDFSAQATANAQRLFKPR